MFTFTDTATATIGFFDSLEFVPIGYKILMFGALLLFAIAGLVFFFTIETHTVRVISFVFLLVASVGLFTYFGNAMITLGNTATTAQSVLENNGIISDHEMTDLSPIAGTNTLINDVIVKDANGEKVLYDMLKVTNIDGIISITQVQ